MSSRANWWAPKYVHWCAGPCPAGAPARLLTRWIFLRCLGLIYFSAFYSLVFQIRGLIGPDGLLPARTYLAEIAKAVSGPAKFWYAPTLLWLSNSNIALLALCWVGMIAAALLVLNFWPRAMLGVCFVAFLSFVTAAQDFSGYQSDGMLLAAGFLALFFAPGGVRPQFGESDAPSRGSLFLLQMLWFAIYFESGVAKYFGGDPSWHNLTAMDEYYQNGPLPTWIGWYVQQLPHWFHASSVVYTLIVELVVVWMLFLPRRLRIVCFFIVTPMQVSIILTANYTFLNYLVLALGFLLLDDKFLVRVLPAKWAGAVRENLAWRPPPESESVASVELANPPRESIEDATHAGWRSRMRAVWAACNLWVGAVFLAWILYASLYLMLEQVSRARSLPSWPVRALEPFRVANSYGLFGRMTWARYEIEFQGSADGKTWIAYPFRYKPQDIREAPRIYAPYQPRFDWNLWFASLGSWRGNLFVLRTEELLLEGNRDALALFRANPFAGAPPKQVRAVIWQYWMTDLETKRETGEWWRREDRGLYAPALERAADGKLIVIAWPGALPPPP